LALYLSRVRSSEVLDGMAELVGAVRARKIDVAKSMHAATTGIAARIRKRIAIHQKP